MNPEFWLERWRSGQIGFHRPQTNEALVRNWSSLRADSAAALPVLVPLCGKSLDLRWLADQGHEVHGVELSAEAVQDFFREWGKPPQALTEGSAGLAMYSAGGVHLHQGDFFAYRPKSGFELFYDRAAMIALPPALRPRYREHLRSLLQPGARGLLITLEYDQGEREGPPFSVLEEELMACPHFSYQRLEKQDILAPSGFAEQGLTWLNHAAWQLTAI